LIIASSSTPESAERLAFYHKGNSIQLFDRRRALQKACTGTACPSRSLRSFSVGYSNGTSRFVFPCLCEPDFSVHTSFFSDRLPSSILALQGKVQ
jgi:hypothetical protein